MNRTRLRYFFRLSAVRAAAVGLAFLSGPGTPAVDAQSPVPGNTQRVVVKLKAAPGTAAPDAPAVQALERAGRLRRTDSAFPAAQGPARAFSQRQKRAAPDGETRAAQLRDALARTFVLTLDSPAAMSEALARLRADPSVEYAEPDVLVSEVWTPNDPNYTAAAMWGLFKIQAGAAWDLSRGAGVVVAVTDSGVDHTHPDIAGNIWTNPGEIAGNGVDDDGNGFVDDWRGWDFSANDNNPADVTSHGTHVAGTVAAVGDNGIGVVGAAPGAKIMMVRGLGDTGTGTLTTLCNTVIYAADNGADVINASWGTNGRYDTARDCMDYAAARGALVIVAAGNGNMDVEDFTPAWVQSAVAVANTDSNDQRNATSNFGAKILVGAPGTSILSLQPGGTYRNGNGTSFAAPHVAGVAALLLSRDPALTRNQVRAIIAASADDIGAPGFDALFGHGRLNAFKALSHGPVPDFALAAPERRAVVSGLVDIRGTAAGATFSSYRIDSGSGAAPSDWTTGPVRGTPVVNGVLESWDSRAVPNGLRAIRLVVTDNAGATYEHRGLVEVQNTAPQDPPPVSPKNLRRRP